MKKLLVLSLTALLALSITACAGNNTTTTSSVAASLTTAPTTVATSSTTNSNEVEVILPAILFTNSTDEQITTMAESQGFISATRNEDGSVTMKMATSVHSKFLEEMKAGLKGKFDSLIGTDLASYVTGIEFNDDLTKVTVKVIRADYEAAVAAGTESDILRIGLFISSIQPFMGKDLTSEVSVVDEGTEEVIKSYVFPEAATALLKEVMAAGSEAANATNAS